jgi:molybdopterin-guanine dinucleotide biosynthesis protein A
MNAHVKGSPLGNISAIILAGGNSTRFKKDKALLKWEGEYLLVRQVNLLKSMFDEVLVVTGDERRYDGLVDARVVEDLVKGKGPLGGIHAGLSFSSNDCNLVIPCDLPFLRKEVLLLLIDRFDGQAQVILPVARGYIEPLVGIYHRSCLPSIERLLRGNRLKVLELLGLVPFRLIPEPDILKVDPDLRSFFNLNSPDDYEKALLINSGRSNG